METAPVKEEEIETICVSEHDSDPEIKVEPGDILFAFTILPDGLTYSCSICVYQTPQRSRLAQHMVEHKNLFAFQCEICGWKHNRKDKV